MADMSARSKPTSSLGSRPPESLADVLRWCAQEAPERIAIEMVDGRCLTYGSLDAHSEALGVSLLERRSGRGNRIALRFDPRQWIEFAIAYFGVAKSGAVAVPLSPRLSAPQADNYCQRFDIESVIDSSDRFFGSVDVHAAPNYPGAPGVPPDIKPDALSAIILTSGTTGEPKAVEISNRELAQRYPKLLPISADFRCMHAFPCTTGSGLAMLWQLFREKPLATLVLPAFDPDKVIELIAGDQIVVLYLTPAMARTLVTSKRPPSAAVALKFVVLSTSPAPPSLLDRLAELLPSASIVNGYGLSESAAAVASVHGKVPRGSVGKPDSATEVRIIDDRGEDLPARAAGRILMRSRKMARRRHADELGGRDDPEDSWTVTGDVGYLDDDGYLFIVDRERDVINVGGLKVSTLEVEDAIYSHPFVADVAVVGLPHEVSGEMIAAAIVRAGTLEIDELRAYLSGRLADYQIPSVLVFAPELPQTEMQKVRKADVRELILKVRENLRHVDLSTNTQKVVAGFWWEVFGPVSIGAEADFLELGGNSLAAAQVASKVADSFDIEVPIALVFERSRLDHFCQAIDDRVRATVAERREVVESVRDGLVKE